MLSLIILPFSAKFIFFRCLPPSLARWWWVRADLSTALWSSRINLSPLLCIVVCSFAKVICLFCFCCGCGRGT
eukprot:12344150-Prorocentrum_lima.AAC.1